MAWITITTADLKDAKVAALVEACQTAALGSGQTDPTPNIIANVIARIRAEIKGCKTNTLETDTATIPPDLKSLASRMIVREMCSRIGRSLSEDEREEQRNDLRYLERIANCEIPVAAPAVPIPGETQTAASSPSIVSKTLYFDRTAQDGI